MNWILRHKVMTIIIVVVLAAGAWYLLSGSSSTEPVLSTDQSAPVPAGTQDLVESLLALRAVTLDGTVFSNPSFQTLRDFTTPIVPEPVGRSDPFAPLGAVEKNSATSTARAQTFAPKR